MRGLFSCIIIGRIYAPSDPKIFTNVAEGLPAVMKRGLKYPILLKVISISRKPNNLLTTY